MNTPYDGDRGRGPVTEPAGQASSPPPATGSQDPYVEDVRSHDPYPDQDPAAQDPVSEALHDRAAYPPRQPGTAPGPQQPPVGKFAAPEGPAGGGTAGGSGQQEEQDAFANLFHDQQEYGRRQAGPETVPQQNAPEPAPAPAKRAGGRASSLLKSSAVMAAGTLVSRLTGFLRQLVITAALGAAFLGDAYTVAVTLPTMIYILTIGGGLNSVFVPQLVRAMKDDDDGGEAYANRLLTLVIVVLGVLVALTVFGAPLLIRMMSVSIADDPQSNEVAVTFARYCLPTIFFMGIHVVMGQILNARGRFGAMMWTPVLNNIVIIFTFGMFIWVYGTASTSQMNVTTITPEGVRLLGIGTLLGLVVQALAMIPYLRDAGFRFRPRFDWRGHGMGKAARLAKWTVLFVLANQAGMLVVTQFATRAGEAADNAGFEGTGILAYNNALLIWQMPQAIITVSVMAALLPRISRSAHDGDTAAVRDDISQGLRNSAVAIVPIAFAFVALGIPMCTLMFSSASEEAARSIGFILMAFGLGLVPYSVQYVVLRGFYAYEDTRTPFYNTVIVAAVNAGASLLSYFLLPDRWVVAGMGFSYGLAYAVGVGVAWNRLSKRLGGDLDGAHVLRTYARLAGASIPAALAAGAAGYGITLALGQNVPGSLAALVGGGIVLAVVFYAAARRMRIAEMTAMVGMVRGRLGR